MHHCDLWEAAYSEGTVAQNCQQNYCPPRLFSAATLPCKMKCSLIRLLRRKVKTDQVQQDSCKFMGLSTAIAILSVCLTVCFVASLSITVDIHA